MSSSPPCWTKILPISSRALNNPGYFRANCLTLWPSRKGCPESCESMEMLLELPSVSVLSLVWPLLLPLSALLSFWRFFLPVFFFLFLACRRMPHTVLVGSKGPPLKDRLPVLIKALSPLIPVSLPRSPDASARFPFGRASSANSFSQGPMPLGLSAGRLCMFKAQGAAASSLTTVSSLRQAELGASYGAEVYGPFWRISR